jgi:hypothetical protein
MDHRSQSDLDRIKDLARFLAEDDSGPAGAHAAELAEAMVDLSLRVDDLSAKVSALWQLISTIVQSAGLSAPAASAAPAEFAQALDTARRTGRRDVRLSIDGREWVAALSQQQQPSPDPASWSAIERLARETADHDEI